MTDKKMVLITLKEYRRLVVRDTELSQLECVGVDNWSGYGEYDSIMGVDGAQEVQEAIDACDKMIFDGIDSSSPTPCITFSNHAESDEEKTCTNATPDGGISLTLKGD